MPNCIFHRLGTFVLPLLLLVACWFPTPCHAADGWAHSVELPKGEVAIELFNGADLSGWEGDTNYFSVQDGVIRAANTGEVPTSTYLFTEASYRDFRLLFEVKQTTGPSYSPMHSALAALGAVKIEGDNHYGFTGPLLMFCNEWGVYDAYGRGRVEPPRNAKPIHRPSSERIGEWNQLEVLVLGNRIRMASNGQLVFDYTESPSTLKISPIGLQLHGNKKPQEYRFRGLVLVDSPVDQMVTVSEARATAPSAAE